MCLSNVLTYAVSLLCRETLLLCLHTPDSGKHLLADTGCPADTPSTFHRTAQKPLPPVHLDSATISTQAPQRSVDIMSESFLVLKLSS